MKRSLWPGRATEFNPDLQITYAVLGELGVLEYTEALRSPLGPATGDGAHVRARSTSSRCPTTKTTAARASDAEMESASSTPRRPTLSAASTSSAT